jgi:hypothetical protein
MILLGLAADPMALCNLLPNASWSLNALDKKTAVFLGVNAFTCLRTPSAPNRVLIFDNREKAESLEGLTYVPDIDPRKAWAKIKAHTGTVKQTRVRSRDVIKELIEKNKDMSFIHLYNTNIYKIKFKYTRDAIKLIYLAYLSGETDRPEFDRQMQNSYPKRGETREAVDKLMELTHTTQFLNLRTALQEVTRIGKDKVAQVAEKYKIETFDLNYLIANMKGTSP